MWGNETEEVTEDNAVAKTGSEILEPVRALTNADTKFDDLYNNIVSSLNTYSTYSSKLQSIEVQELSKQLTSKSTRVEYDELTTKEKVNKLLNNVDDDILGNLGEVDIPSARKQRYQFYEEIPNVNYIAYRMLKVYMDNILIKNVQTKQFLNINSNQNNIAFLKTVENDIGKFYENFMKTSSIYFDLQKKLKNKIVPDMLKFGNSFVEVLNLKDIHRISTGLQLINETDMVSTSENSPSYELLYESIDANNICFYSDPYKGKLFEESDDIVIQNDTNIESVFKRLIKSKSVIEEADNNFYSDVIGDDESDDDYKFSDIADVDFNEIENIYLKTISPNNVIIIEEDGILYGYIIVEDYVGKSENEIDTFKRFTQQESSASADESAINRQLIENMTNGIIQKINTSINYNRTNLKGLDLTSSLESSIKIILYHKIKEKTQLKFRFIPTNKLINFSTNIDKFGPYGTSIFDPIIQPVKMYTLALMSSIVSRLSRASVVRKWTIEAGNKKNHAEMVEKVKKDISNKSISFDSLSNIKNISKVITDFRDIATIQVNGQRFIDMEVMPMGDRSLPLNDMQELRNELIASTGVPSVYLNVGDQVDLRETLVNLNTSFATTISSFQGNIDDALSSLMNSIFNIVLENNEYQQDDFLLSNYYSFSLNPPLVLTVQANEALISSVTNIIGMLKSADVIVDPNEILKLYIPQMNWTDFIKTGESFIKKQAKEMLMQPQEDQG